MDRHRRGLLRLRSAAAVLLAAVSHGVQAAGFALDFESARALSLATSGSASGADASAVFYNPAGMALLGHDQVLAGGQLFLLHDRFHDEGSTLLAGAIPTPGGDGEQAIPTKFIPWLFGVHRVDERLAWGVGLFSPFGLQTGYGTRFVGRYQNDFSALQVIDINPSVAWRPVPGVALGAGFTGEWAHVQLRNSIDMGSLCVAQLGLSTCTGFGLPPGGADGQTELNGHDWAAGYDLGVIAQSADAMTRAGISYRSRIDHHFDRVSQSFDIQPAGRAFLAAGGMPQALTGGNATTDLPLPARLVLGLWHRLESGIELSADAALTRWSAFQATVVTPDDPATGFPLTIEQRYRDAWRYAAGASFPLDGGLELRAGLGHDATPVPAAFVQAALPDRDRTYLTAGVGYRFDGHWSVDAGYAFVKYAGRIPIDRTGLTADRLRGHFDVGGSIVAVQVRYDR